MISPSGRDGRRGKCDYFHAYFNIFSVIRNYFQSGVEGVLGGRGERGGDIQQFPSNVTRVENCSPSKLRQRPNSDYRRISFKLWKDRNFPRPFCHLCWFSRFPSWHARSSFGACSRGEAEEKTGVITITSRRPSSEANPVRERKRERERNLRYLKSMKLENVNWCKFANPHVPPPPPVPCTGSEPDQDGVLPKKTRINFPTEIAQLIPLNGTRGTIFFFGRSAGTAFPVSDVPDCHPNFPL